MESVLAFDKFHRITQTGGNIYVTAELTDGEHHSTNRADARMFVRMRLGVNYDVLAYLGKVHYRRADGYPVTAKRYSVIKLPTLYNFPGYDNEPRTAESALQEWIDTQELDLSEDETEALYQFTLHTESAEFNIRAIQQGADYSGVDLTHSPLPTPIKNGN